MAIKDPLTPVGRQRALMDDQNGRDVRVAVVDTTAGSRTIRPERDVPCEAVADASSDPVLAELERIEETAKNSAQTQFSSGKFWRGLNLCLGVPAAVAAAVAGAAGLADSANAQTAAVIALIAAALTAVMTTLNAAQRAEQSRIAANAYLDLQGDARVARTIDVPGLDLDDRRARLQELIERRNTINASAPIPSFIAYRLGQRNLEKGRQTYEVDK